MTAAALALTACSSDEPGGGQLPDGKYPLQLMASVGSLQSRAAGKDSWLGGEDIAVNIGDYTGKYTMDATGNATASDTPYYWQNTAKATVKAWYPFANSEQTYDISDQSTGYAAFDFLYAETEGSYASPVSLTFNHQMSKVSYTLAKGDGITDAELAAASITLFGEKSVTVSGGKITSSAASQTDEISPCHDAAAHSGSAVMVPQNMSGNPLIKVSISGNDFVYTPSAGEGSLQGGYCRSYTITVKADGIEVTAATGGEWTNGGSENVTSYTTYEADVLKLGDYYYSDGTWSDGGLRKLYADGSMEWAEAIPQPESDKTVIGIVFHAGQHENDGSDYSSTGIGQQKCHGYAVSLKDATSGYCMWGVYETELGCYPTDGGGNKLDNYGTPDIDWSGYAWTQTIITTAGGKDNLNATNDVGYPATYYAVVDYKNKVKSPDNSSGWFLPSIGQMWKIYQNSSSLFGPKPGAENLKADWYWSSSEPFSGSAEIALYVNVRDGHVDGGDKDGSFRYVRPVLAF